MTSRRELELVDEVQARAANRGSRPMPGFGQSAFLIVIRTYVVVLPNPWDLRQSPAYTSPTRNCGLSLFLPGSPCSLSRFVPATASVRLFGLMVRLVTRVT